MVDRKVLLPFFYLALDISTEEVLAEVGIGRILHCGMCGRLNKQHMLSFRWCIYVGTEGFLLLW